MPKLVIDEPIVKMLMEKLARFSIHAGPNGNLMAPGVQDLVDGNEGGSPWQPGDERTKLLVLGGEACREISFHIERFNEERARKRILKNLSVPICSLMDVVVDLQKTFNDVTSRKTQLAWPASDQRSYVEIGRRLRKIHRQGPVRTLRHKLAHLDLEAFGLGYLNPRPLLEALGDALIILMLSLNHKACAFSWIRPVFSSEDGTKLVVDTMFDYPASVRWMTDREGKVLGLIAIQLAKDPRHVILESVMSASQGYNYLVQATGTNLPKMYLRPTEEVLAEECRSPSKQSNPDEGLFAEAMLAKKSKSKRRIWRVPSAKETSLINCLARVDSITRKMAKITWTE